MPYLFAATLLVAATLLALWTAMRWPAPRPDLTASLLGGAAVAVWAAFNDAHPGPSVGSLPFTAADILALPALLSASLLMGRTVLLRHHPHPHPSVAAAPPAVAQDTTAQDTTDADAVAEATNPGPDAAPHDGPSPATG